MSSIESVVVTGASRGIVEGILCIDSIKTTIIPAMLVSVTEYVIEVVDTNIPLY